MDNTDNAGHLAPEMAGTRLNDVPTTAEASDVQGLRALCLDLQRQMGTVLLALERLLHALVNFAHETTLRGAQ